MENYSGGGGSTGGTLEEVLTAGNKANNTITLGHTDTGYVDNTVIGMGTIKINSEDGDELFAVGKLDSSNIGKMTLWSQSNEVAMAPNGMDFEISVGGGGAVVIKQNKLKGTSYVAATNDEDYVMKKYVDDTSFGLTYNGANKFLVSNSTGDGYVWVDEIDAGTYS